MLSETDHATMRRIYRLETSPLHDGYKDVVVSSIVHHHSANKVRDNIKTVNEHLQLMCARNGWPYIDNDNIGESCLAEGNLQLN